jgi:predicted transcriptional regulator
MCTNQRIADPFGLTYSSVSRIVKSARLRMKQDRRFREKLESIYSQFKMMTPDDGHLMAVG